MFELLFIMEGRVCVGYRLFNEIHYAKQLEHKSVINDYASILDRCSEFLYVTMSPKLTGYAIRKHAFKELLLVHKDIGDTLKREV